MARTRTDPIKRFWSHVEKTATCWLWSASCWHNGYGRFVINEKGRREIPAHVFSYQLHFGKPEKPFERTNNQVHHKCDVRRCVRPDHLWNGTQKENQCDMSNKGRSLRGEKHKNWTKLTKRQALLAKNSTIAATVLAERWGVVKGTIYNIRSGLTWSWLK